MQPSTLGPPRTKRCVSLSLGRAVGHETKGSAVECNNTPAEEIAVVEGLTPDAPVTMVNLLRFKQPDGREHYFRYGAEIAPLLQKAGATVRYDGSSPLYVIGDRPRPWWDMIVIVEYLTPEAFLMKVTNEEYRVAHVHRAAALDRAELIATSPF
jgi:uncharacterized protein (DUF1330 family)